MHPLSDILKDFSDPIPSANEVLRQIAILKLEMKQLKAAVDRLNKERDAE